MKSTSPSSPSLPARHLRVGSTSLHRAACGAGSWAPAGYLAAESLAEVTCKRCQRTVAFLQASTAASSPSSTPAIGTLTAPRSASGADRREQFEQPMHWVRNVSRDADTACGSPLDVSWTSEANDVTCALCLAVHPSATLSDEPLDLDINKLVEVPPLLCRCGRTAIYRLNSKQDGLTPGCPSCALNLTSCACEPAAHQVADTPNTNAPDDAVADRGDGPSFDNEFEPLCTHGIRLDETCTGCDRYAAGPRDERPYAERYNGPRDERPFFAPSAEQPSAQAVASEAQRQRELHQGLALLSRAVGHFERAAAVTSECRDWQSAHGPELHEDVRGLALNARLLYRRALNTRLREIADREELPAKTAVVAAGWRWLGLVGRGARQRYGIALLDARGLVVASGLARMPADAARLAEYLQARLARRGSHVR
ncbi:hypothetical protein MYSTI_04147 [Myxococcus stipitatus DSM 14675]|uniref:Uncharacterized protein n=1 Tax=Myxococcus stipitatus (strain DSM 14675 / JCM 12634 / Mx s8) TaxID=1278073 RepID=L7UCZ8_MYXSD|nr:hypothetical protein [Myxococcus stipitatus]AGC45447.1 hypothetical protein MYSTI_04147 [Myxococcus stipitatus DSM 14675]